MPVTLDDPDHGVRLFLQGQCQKVHDYDVSLSGAVEQNASAVHKMQFQQGSGVEGLLAAGMGRR